MGHGLDASQTPNLLHGFGSWASFVGPMSSWLSVRRHPPLAHDRCGNDVVPLPVNAAPGCGVVLQTLCMELVQSQSGEFEPLPVFSQNKSASQQASACSGACSSWSGVVILLLSEDLPDPWETVYVEGDLLIEVCWLAEPPVIYHWLRS